MIKEVKRSGVGIGNLVIGLAVADLRGVFRNGIPAFTELLKLVVLPMK